MTASDEPAAQPLTADEPLLKSPTRPSDQADDATYDVDTAIEAIGLGKFQYIVLLLTGLSWTTESMEMLLLSFMKSPLQCEWGISDEQAALITTFVALGMLFGAVWWGVVADYYGRRIGFITVAVCTAVTGLVSAASVSYPMMLAARGLTGFCIGGAHVSFSVLIEMMPAAQRGSWGLSLAFFWALGAIFEAGVAIIVLPSLGWRWLIVLSTLPLFLVIPLCVWLPESPRWLISKGRLESAQTVLQRVAGINGFNLPEGRVTAAAAAMEDEAPSASGFSSLFRRGARVLSLQIAVVWFMAAMVYYGVIMLQPELIAAENAGHRCAYAAAECAAHATGARCQARHICAWTGGNSCVPTGTLSDTSTRAVGATTAGNKRTCAHQLSRADLVSTLWASVGELPGVLVAFLVVNAIGRRPLIGYMCALSAAGFLALTQCIGRAGETVVFFFTRGSTLAFFQTISLYTNEVYPSAVRSRAMGVASAVARCGLVLTPFVAQYLSNINASAALIVYAASSVAALLAVCGLAVETTRRPLVISMDELVDSLRNGEQGLTVTFAKDPGASSFVRFLRWRARLDGAAST